jgi:Tripartite tricarboxylate transporter TctB family
MTPSGPRLTIGGKTITIDLPHLAFATAIAVWCAWFCQDAWHAQQDVENLIMIVPASILAMILYVVVAAGCFHVVPAEDQNPVAPRRPLAPGIAGKITGTMALLGAYVTCAPLFGFDVASFVYILAMLLLLGERRILILVLVPAVFCAIVIYCFNTVLATPLPLLLFPGDGA